MSSLRILFVSKHLLYKRTVCITIAYILILFSVSILRHYLLFVKMTLPGFCVPCWCGWIVGVLVLTTPWDTKFSTWINLHTFYSITINICTLAMSSFFQYTSVKSYITSESTASSVSFVLFQLVFFLHVYLRLCFMLNAKEISLLLAKAQLKYDVGLGYTNTLTVLDRILLSATLTLIILTSSGRAYIFCQSSDFLDTKSGENDFTHIIAIVGYFSLGSFPFYSVVYITFAYILVTTKFIIQVLELMYTQIECVLENSKSMHFNVETDSKIWNIELRRSFCSKRILLEIVLPYYDDLVGILHSYDKAVGPLLLGLVTLTTVAMVQGLDDFLVEEYTFISFFTDLLTILFHILQIYVLHLGYSIHRMMTLRITKLQKLVALTPFNIHTDDITHVVKLIYRMEWKMTACGFFVIDRSLISGILSIILSYIVILFQLQK